MRVNFMVTRYVGRNLINFNLKAIKVTQYSHKVHYSYITCMLRIFSSIFYLIFFLLFLVFFFLYYIFYTFIYKLTHMSLLKKYIYIFYFFYIYYDLLLL